MPHRTPNLPDASERVLPEAHTHCLILPGTQHMLAWEEKRWKEGV